MRGRPALTDLSFDWVACLPVFPLLSTTSCAEAQLDPPCQDSIKEFIDGVSLYQGKKNLDPAHRGGAYARRDSLVLRKATSSSVAAAAAILGWEEAAEGLAAQ